MTTAAGAETTGVETLRARYREVQARAAAAALRAGRDPAGVTIVAVSKTHTADLLREAVEAGMSVFGENKVQEAEGKIASVGRGGAVSWHLIGHLQSNKARRAARLFDLIHTLDSAELALRLERVCAEEGRGRLDVLVQVDLAGEEAKSGARADDLPAVAEALGECPRVRCRGLMTLPPYYQEAELVRPFFRRLRELRDEWGGRGLFGEGGGELSMGMSHDYEVAVEEGATLIRVGTALFGERKRTLK